MTRVCDRIFTGGLVFLILFTPFAIGSVHPPVYSFMEAVIFGLVIVWMFKRAILAREHGAWSTERGAEKIRNSKSAIRNCAIPLALFIALCLFQMLPLPPSFLRLISPQTYEAYTQILPGWPERVPYSDLPVATEVGGQRSEVRDQKSEVGGQREEGEEQGARSTEQSAKGQAQSAEVAGQQAETPNATNANNATNAINATNATNAVNPQSDTKFAIRNSKSEIPASLLPQTWLPLSFSPFLTWPDLLKFIAFAGLFFLVWRYPFERPFENFEIRNSNSEFFILSPEQRFLRTMVFAIVSTGLLVAAIGFAHRFSGDQKILWFFVPYDSPELDSGIVPRASGPFVNPDHFANYLSLILPLALACALFRTFMVPKSRQDGFKILCGFTSFLLFTAVLLSLSRGGWIAALAGVVVFVWVAPWGGAARGRRSEVRDQRRGHRARSRERGAGRGENPQSAMRNSKFASVARLSLSIIAILLAVSLFVAGPGGREGVDERLGETFGEDTSLSSRVGVWRDTLSMVRDFPMIGVGLGAWPEVYIHYRPAPWILYFFREAHNDYVEVLAETGIIGFSLLVWFFVLGGRRLVQALKTSSSKNLPVIAGIVAGIGAMAVHEGLDFNLQIPANAFLFTILLAIGLRLAGSVEQGAWSREHGAGLTPNTQHPIPHTAASVASRSAADSMLHAPSSMRAGPSRLTPYAGIAAAVGMIACAITQDQVFYPYNLKEAESLAEVKELVQAYPNHAPYHVALLHFLGEDAPISRQLSELRAALWLEPINPYIRDAHAAVLMKLGQEDEGLKILARSVADSPSLQTHDYLSDEALPELSESQQAAVEEGFKQALARDYPEALKNFGEFYAKLGRFTDQGKLYEQAALKETDSAKKTELLIEGGIAYVKAAEKQGAGSESEVRGQRSEVGSQRSEVSGQRSDGKEQSATPNATSQRSEVRSQRSDGKAQSETRDATNAERNNATNATNPINAMNATDNPQFAIRNAERLFRAAIAINPSDPKAYHHLVTSILGVGEDLEGARQLIADGIKNGAPALPLYFSLAEAAHKGGSPEEVKAALELAKSEVEKVIRNGENPYTLYIALADGARRAGDRDEENGALLKALDRQPRSTDILMRLASLNSQRRNFDRAALYLNRIANINPDSPEVFYRIAQAEESRYRFAAAGRAYARAIELSPGNASYLERYEAFKARVDRNRVTGDGGPGLSGELGAKARSR